MKGTITYLIGDATAPVGSGLKVIPHICNDKRVWGRGFVLALRAKWPECETVYKEMIQELGQVSLCKVESDVYVANMIAQRGIQSETNPTPIRYSVLRSTLETVATFAKVNSASIHMPRIGAGGIWELIESIIIETLVDQGLNVTVYDLPKEAKIGV